MPVLYSPQRGSAVIDPFGGAFLMPRPQGVVDDLTAVAAGMPLPPGRKSLQA